MATTGVNPWELKDLTDKHKTVASLMAQGLKPAEIGKLVGYTPQYVTMLTRDPQFKAYLRGMVEFSEARLEAMFTETVDVIAEGLQSGNLMEDRLKAARLQLEVTGRVGKVERTQAGNEDSINRLVRLSERLLALKTPTERTYDGEARVVLEQDERVATDGQGHPEHNGHQVHRPAADSGQTSI